MLFGYVYRRVCVAYFWVCRRSFGYTPTDVSAPTGRMPAARMSVFVKTDPRR